MKTPKLLLPHDYVRLATEHINAATSHVSFLCMMVTDDLSTDELIEALASAAKRGVDVQVAADVFTYGEFGGHFVPLKYYTKQSRRTTSMAKRLVANGVKFTWLGRFSALPITGRTHIKALVVDDTVYSFGGVNLDEQSLNFSDYMFQCVDAELAANLRDDITRLIAADGGNFSYRSHEFNYGEHSTVLVDGGFQGDSIIYRRACHYAQEAKHILFVSQYCPTGKLGRILRKRKTNLYFNRPSLTNNLINQIVIHTGMFFSRQTTQYSRDTYLHAKFMIFTMPDSTKVAITGSHNFVWGGVLLGTREIALLTTDPKIIKQLEAFFNKYVK